MLRTVSRISRRSRTTASAPLARAQAADRRLRRPCSSCRAGPGGPGDTSRRAGSRQCGRASSWVDSIVCRGVGSRRSAGPARQDFSFWRSCKSLVWSLTSPPSAEKRFRMPHSMAEASATPAAAWRAIASNERVETAAANSPSRNSSRCRLANRTRSWASSATKSGTVLTQNGDFVFRWREVHDQDHRESVQEGEVDLVGPGIGCAEVGRGHENDPVGHRHDGGVAALVECQITLVVQHWQKNVEGVAERCGLSSSSRMQASRFWTASTNRLG